MRKTLLIILTLILLLGLCACSNAPAANNPSADCTHSWRSANCYFPKTCTLCSTTEGKALGHTFQKGKCTVCGADDPEDNPLTDGTWFYISKQKWHILEFYPDGTCEIRSVVGMPFSGVTVEECVDKAIASLQQTYRNNWEQIAKTKYQIFKILDYYYAGEMSIQSMDYRIENGLIVIEQPGALAIYVKLEKRGKLVSMGDNDWTYVNMEYQHITSLWNAYEMDN